MLKQFMLIHSLPTVLTGAQVGSVLQLTPQIDDMGDDSNLDHHVSPFCEVRDV